LTIGQAFTLRTVKAAHQKCHLFTKQFIFLFEVVELGLRNGCFSGHFGSSVKIVEMSISSGHTKRKPFL
ncbi:hypothetical protein, partial [Lacticaseibacillus rhamnosus]|uniref:hypothetical protein n=1 Tax=Lacticaseibacillus rhamnosus TaxID=47715 RepID=UPI00254FA6C4